MVVREFLIGINYFLPELVPTVIGMQNFRWEHYVIGYSIDVTMRVPPCKN